VVAIAAAVAVAAMIVVAVIETTIVALDASRTVARAQVSPLSTTR
jgi:hypothetical protein